MDGIGDPDENGTYDGAIGQIQSNELNTFQFFFPYDSVPYEPGIFVQSPVAAFTPHIYSGKINGSQQFGLQVQYLIHNFSFTIWLYWIISLTICSITIIAIIFFKSEMQELKIRKILKRFAYSYWNYIMLAFDMAPSVVSNKLSCSIIWTCIVLAIYYGIHMVFMSTFSADLSAKSPDFWIDSLDDLLFDPSFQSIRPTIFRMMNTYRALSQSIPGSKERIVLDRAKKLGGLEVVDIKDHQQIFFKARGYLAGLQKREIAIIEDNFMVDNMVAKAACFMLPELVDGMVKSQYPVYNVPNAMILSKSTHPEVVKLFEYRSVNSVEFGIQDGTLRHYEKNMKQLIGVQGSMRGLLCELQFLNIIHKENDQEWLPLPFHFFEQFFISCSTILLASFFVLMFEKALFYVKSSLNLYPRRIIDQNCIPTSSTLGATEETDEVASTEQVANVEPDITTVEKMDSTEILPFEPSTDTVKDTEESQCSFSQRFKIEFRKNLGRGKDRVEPLQISTENKK